MSETGAFVFYHKTGQIKLIVVNSKSPKPVAAFVRWGYPEAQEVNFGLLFLFTTF